MSGSALMLSLFSLFGKLSIDNLPFFLLVFLRFAVPFVLVTCFLLWNGQLKGLVIKDRLSLHCLRVGFSLIYQYSIFYYLTQASLLDATVLQNTAPLFIPLLDWVFFKVRPDLKAIASILIAFVGVICILQPDRGVFARLSFIGLLAPLGQAGSQVLYGRQSRNENQSITLFYFFFFSTVIAGIIFVCSGEFLDLGEMREKQSFLTYSSVFAIGVVSIFNQSLRGKAYQFAKPSHLVPFLYLSLIFSSILDWILFHHLPNLFSIVGAILVMISGIFQVYHNKKQI